MQIHTLQMVLNSIRRPSGGTNKTKIVVNIDTLEIYIRLGVCMGRHAWERAMKHVMAPNHRVIGTKISTKEVVCMCHDYQLTGSQNDFTFFTLTFFRLTLVPSYVTKIA